MRASTLATVFLIVAAAGGPAGAQAALQSARTACRPSALALCHAEVKSGDRVAVRACLIKNFDKVSPDCQAAMKAVQAQSNSDKPDAAASKH